MRGPSTNTTGIGGGGAISSQPDLAGTYTPAPPTPAPPSSIPISPQPPTQGGGALFSALGKAPQQDDNMPRQQRQGMVRQ